MAIKIFVEVSGDDVVGYFRDDIHSTIPVGVIEITDPEWKNALAINANKFISGVFSFVPRFRPKSEVNESNFFLRIQNFQERSNPLFFQSEISGLPVDRQAWLDEVAAIKLEFPLTSGFDTEAFTLGFC